MLDPASEVLGHDELLVVPLDVDVLVDVPVLVPVAVPRLDAELTPLPPLVVLDPVVPDVAVEDVELPVELPAGGAAPPPWPQAASATVAMKDTVVVGRYESAKDRRCRGNMGARTLSRPATSRHTKSGSCADAERQRLPP